MDKDVFSNGYVSFSNRALDQQKWLITRSQSRTNRMQSQRAAADPSRFNGQNHSMDSDRTERPVECGEELASNQYEIKYL